MPPVQPDVVRGNLHKLEEQQQGNDQPLPLGRNLVKDGAPGLQEGREMVEEIEADACRDGERQHPVLEELNGFIHGAWA